MASRYANAHCYRLPVQGMLTAVQRGLVGPIISRFENRGFKLVAIKLITPSKEHLEKHYADLSDKPFFPGLIACTPSHHSLAILQEQS
jgi:nucleoside-diphosphate kinase